MGGIPIDPVVSGAEVGPIASEEPVLKSAFAEFLYDRRPTPSRNHLFHRHAFVDRVRPDGIGGV